MQCQTQRGASTSLSSRRRPTPDLKVQGCSVCSMVGFDSLEGGSIKLDAGSNTEEVSMTTVDNFVREHKISDLDVLKIDTEGNDNKVCNCLTVFLFI